MSTNEQTLDRAIAALKEVQAALDDMTLVGNGKPTDVCRLAYHSGAISSVISMLNAGKEPLSF